MQLLNIIILKNQIHIYNFFKYIYKNKQKCVLWKGNEMKKDMKNVFPYLKNGKHFPLF